MVTVVNITGQGTLTLPLKARKRLGISANARVVVEDTLDGVVLRRAVESPTENYSAKRLEEFRRGEADLAPFAGELRAALAKAKSRHGRRK